MAGAYTITHPHHLRGFVEQFEQLSKAAQIVQQNLGGDEDE